MLTLTAPYAVTSGAGFKVGAIIAVATAAAVHGAAVEGLTQGVVDAARASAQAWAVGDKVYWDDTARLFATVATSNALAGVAVTAAANPSAGGRVAAQRVLPIAPYLSRHALLKRHGIDEPEAVGRQPCCCMHA